jgi:hypothetical protein
MEILCVPSVPRALKMGMPMPPLRSRGGHSAARVATLRPSTARARGMTAALIGIIIFLTLLTGEIQFYAQGRTATASLVLHVQPEELLQARNGSVVLKIRLARGTTARLWAASSCASPSAESQVIMASGTYTIPNNTLTPVRSSSAPGTMQVCLLSSDGVLHDSIAVEILGAGNAAAAEGATQAIAPNGVSVAVPDGWVVTTQAGTTTWSNP